MRKMFAFLLVFALGIGLAVFALANPFGWTWLGPVRARFVTSGDGRPAPRRPNGRSSTGARRWTRPTSATSRASRRWAWTSCPSTRTRRRATPAERKIKYWRAPMDPTYIRDKPGKSPMGMDLVPVYEDEDTPTPPGFVQIDPAFVQTIGVQTADVKRADIPLTIRTVGTLGYNDEQVSWVTTKYDGWIEKVYVNYVGEKVTKGQEALRDLQPAARDHREGVPAGDRLRARAGDPAVSRHRRARALARGFGAAAPEVLGHQRRADRRARAHARSRGARSRSSPA